MAKKKYYVVWDGHQPGIYESWNECKLQVKGYPNAEYKSFTNREQAEAAFYQGFTPPSASAKKEAPNTYLDYRTAFSDEIELDSLAVDAACSGNPGRMEYQGVDTNTQEQIFHQQFELGTNNIGEFLAIVHGLAYCQQKEWWEKPIYTDSTIAIKWIKNGKCRTQLNRNARSEKLFQVIARAEQWLAKNTFRNPLLKWNTEKWGEIPADFGRK